MAYRNFPDRTFQELMFARDAIAHDLQYLREKEWRVFSWASSIQLGIVGGVITLAGLDGFLFPPLHRLLIAVVSLVLALYSFFWIRQNLKREADILNVLSKYDVDLSIESTGWSIKSAQIGYLWTICLLETAVLLTIVLVIIPN